ncbi:MAG: tripartite tricarboxylate transporter TctB family protein [Thermodesulfobacteriota bacterium]
MALEAPGLFAGAWRHRPQPGGVASSREERPVRTWDLAITVLITLIGGYVAAAGWRLGFGAFEAPGPGFIAVFAGSLLALCSAANMILTIARPQKHATQPFWPESDSYRNVLLTLAGPVAFTLLLNYLGFFLCTVGLLVYLLRIIHPHRISLILVLSLSTAVVCLVLFQFVLQVQFPPGLIDFHLVKRWFF